MQKNVSIYIKKWIKLILEEAPVVVLFYDEVLRFTQKNIEGLGINPTNLLELKNVQKN
jgi:peptide/nickel transport system substrate-binding protein